MFEGSVCRRMQLVMRCMRKLRSFRINRYGGSGRIILRALKQTAPAILLPLMLDLENVDNALFSL